MIWILTVTKKNKVCRRGRFWKITPDKKQQKRVPENVNICESPDPDTIRKELSVEFAAPLISFKSPGIWRGTAVWNVIFYFLTFLRWTPAFSLRLRSYFVFLQAGHHICKSFYWNQGIFMQLNSFPCFGTWSLESKLMGKASSSFCSAVRSRAVSLQPCSWICSGTKHSGCPAGACGWVGGRSAIGTVLTFQGPPSHKHLHNNGITLNERSSLHPR